MSSENIELLVRNAKNGDRDSFGELYEIFSKEMYSFACWYLGDGTLAEDAVSDAVLNAFLSVKNIKKPEKFKSWLFTILLRSCQKQLKSIISMRQTVDIDTVEKKAEGVTLEEKTELKQALACLSEQEREIFLLSTLGNLTSNEIGSMLSLAPGTVRSKISRTSDKLYDMLGERSAVNG